MVPTLYTVSFHTQCGNLLPSVMNVEGTWSPVWGQVQKAAVNISKHWPKGGRGRFTKHSLIKHRTQDTGWWNPYRMDYNEQTWASLWNRHSMLPISVNHFKKYFFGFPMFHNRSTCFCQLTYPPCLWISSTGQDKLLRTKNNDFKFSWWKNPNSTGRMWNVINKPYYHYLILKNIECCSLPCALESCNTLSFNVRNLYILISIACVGKRTRLVKWKKNLPAGQELAKMYEKLVILTLAFLVTSL